MVTHTRYHLFGKPRSGDWIVAVCRLTNAFAYYGIVLVTTELFQVDDVCGSKFLSLYSLTHCVKTVSGKVVGHSLA